MLRERRKLTEKKVVKSASSVNPAIPKKLFTLEFVYGLERRLSTSFTAVMN
jgi:hypothetical protein